MIKKYKKTLIISSLTLLIPVIVGLLLWNRLPEQIIIHWGLNNTPDGWAGKELVVFGLPVLLLAAQWVGVLLTSLDPIADCYRLVMVSAFGNKIKDVSKLTEHEIIVNYDPTAAVAAEE